MDLQDFLGEELKAAWPDQIHHLSASSIGMLFRCPRQFERRYLHHEKERPGESIVVGSFFHEGLQHNYEQKVNTHEDRPVSMSIEWMQDVGVPKVIEENGGVDNIRWDSDLDTARSDAERMFVPYYREIVPRIQPIGVESRFELEIPGLHVPVIGYLDVWEAGRNLDTKTGKQAANKVKPSWALQGRLYSWATERPTEYHSISRAKHPRIVTGLESADMVVPVPSEAQKANMAHMFRTAAAQISHYWTMYGDEGWPTFGAVPDFTRNMLPCDYCGWRKGCPAWA